MAKQFFPVLDFLLLMNGDSFLRIQISTMNSMEFDQKHLVGKIVNFADLMTHLFKKVAI